MEENEYIELQNLLTKLRVEALKELSDRNIVTKCRDRDVKMIRYVDWLRANMFLKIKEE